MFTPEWWSQLAVQVVVAVLTVIVSMLTYEKQVAQKREKRLHDRMDAYEKRADW